MLFNLNCKLCINHVFKQLITRQISTSDKFERQYLIFLHSHARGKGRYIAALLLKLTLLLTPIETVCQSDQAPSQSSPRVEYQRTFTTMLHCSLHIAYLPQRGRGFNKETIRKDEPLCWGGMLWILSLSGAFMSSLNVVMMRWKVSNNCTLPLAGIKVNLCPMKGISWITYPFFAKGVNSAL